MFQVLWPKSSGGDSLLHSNRGNNLQLQMLLASMWRAEDQAEDFTYAYN